MSQAYMNFLHKSLPEVLAKQKSLHRILDEVASLTEMMRNVQPLPITQMHLSDLFSQIPFVADHEHLPFVKMSQAYMNFLHKSLPEVLAKQKSLHRILDEVASLTEMMRNVQPLPITQMHLSDLFSQAILENPEAAPLNANIGLHYFNIEEDSTKYTSLVPTSKFNVYKLNLSSIYCVKLFA
ncbi:hypothetical protein EGR_08987 [Echinococcus granulosus]|uniref:Uncharacterized protein n=1 Tax=Echinococcus granulosus TaxID=6210 RepID=W6UD04_ECHGR|nr:hypothetical protein EGR_08987 [Echinococcus granulosus]EUB56182.1 hypothetical protein EGR_08987 [Echinococcus granulosus]